jgi:hypothetical protein
MADIILLGLSLGQIDPDPLQYRFAHKEISLGSSVSGSIGFRYEGGIITVLADSAEIDINFDRPMTYNGVFTPVPGGTPYDILQPFLSLDTKRISIPITVPAATLALVSLTPASNQIVLEWGANVQVLLTSGWSISNLTGAAVLVTSVIASGTQVLVNTTEHTSGGNYTLNIPANSVASVGGLLADASANPYVGVGITPIAFSAQFLSSDTVLVTYDEPMDLTSATDIANYNIPGLTIQSITSLTSVQFILKVTPMVPNTAYNLTITGVKDIAQNPV